MPNRQRGVALLVALLVVALAVILVAALLDRGELALARTRNVLRSEQAEAYAQGLEIYAVQVLIETHLQQGADTNASPWATPLPPQSVPGGVISATMGDMNGCFNLNNLSGSNAPQWALVFQKLLAARGIDPALSSAVQNWLGDGTSDDNYYLGQAVPYRSAHRPFAHVSELRLVKGVDGDVYARLAPYVCALPAGTAINVNTASVPVLLAFGMSQSNAEKVWNNGQANFQDPGQFFQQAQIRQQGLPPNAVDVSSTYFLARGEILLDDVPFTFYSLIDRSQVPPRVIARSRGSDDALVAPAAIDGTPARDDTLH